MSEIIATVRECPRCAEEIKTKALVCKHCGFDVIKWGIDEENKEKRPTRRKRSNSEVAKTIDNAIFDTIYHTHKVRISASNIDEIRGLKINLIDSRTFLHLRHPSGNDERITHDAMIKRAKELGVIYDDGSDREAADSKSAQILTQIQMALIIGFFTIVIVWLIMAAISPKPLSGREKAMELYCNKSGVTCGPDKMKEIFRD